MIKQKQAPNDRALLMRIDESLRHVTEKFGDNDSAASSERELAQS